MTDRKIQHTLNDLIELARDGSEFYAEAAGKVGNAELSTLFRQMGEQKRGVIVYLREGSVGVGQQPRRDLQGPRGVLPRDEPPHHPAGHRRGHERRAQARTARGGEQASAEHLFTLSAGRLLRAYGGAASPRRPAGRPAPRPR